MCSYVRSNYHLQKSWVRYLLLRDIVQQMNKHVSELLGKGYYQAINKQDPSEDTNLQEQDAVNLQIIHSMAQAAQYGLTDTLNMKNLEIFQGVCFAVHQLCGLNKGKNVVRSTVPRSIISWQEDI